MKDKRIYAVGGRINGYTFLTVDETTEPTTCPKCGQTFEVVKNHIPTYCPKCKEKL